MCRLIELSAVKTDWYCGVNIRRDFHKNDGSSCSEKWMGPSWDPGKQCLTFGFTTLSVVVCGFKLRFGGETKGLTYFGFPVLKGLGLRVYLECIHLRLACSMWMGEKLTFLYQLWLLFFPGFSWNNVLLCTPLTDIGLLKENCQGWNKMENTNGRS